MTFDRGTEPPLIRLEGELDIAVADELKRVLMEALAAKRAFRLSLEKTTTIDITALQLLWAAGCAAKAAGVSLMLQGTLPEAMRATAFEAGIECFPRADEAITPAEVRA